jgi:type VI protein secretion system component Hcp
MRHFSRTLLAFALLLLTCAPTTRATITVDLQVPGITGEDNPPGFPGSMRLQTFSFATHSFAAAKLVDSASPQLINAVAVGPNLGTSRALIYNGTTATGTPAAELRFANTFATAYQSLGGMPAAEKDSFASTGYTLMYLEVPGINGPASTPGHTGLLPVDIFSLDSGDFTAARRTDSASPGLTQAVVQGTHFSTVAMLLYDTSPAGPAPDSTLLLHDVLATSYQTLTGPETAPNEQTTFEFATATPEPDEWELPLLTAVGALVTRRRA